MAKKELHSDISNALKGDDNTLKNFVLNYYETDKLINSKSKTKQLWINKINYRTDKYQERLSKILYEREISLEDYKKECELLISLDNNEHRKNLINVLTSLDNNEHRKNLINVLTSLDNEGKKNLINVLTSLDNNEHQKNLINLVTFINSKLSAKKKELAPILSFIDLEDKIKLVASSEAEFNLILTDIIFKKAGVNDNDKSSRHEFAIDALEFEEKIALLKKINTPAYTIEEFFADKIRAILEDESKAFAHHELKKLFIQKKTFDKIAQYPDKIQAIQKKLEKEDLVSVYFILEDDTAYMKYLLEDNNIEAQNDADIGNLADYLFALNEKEALDVLVDKVQSSFSQANDSSPENSLSSRESVESTVSTTSMSSVDIASSLAKKTYLKLEEKIAALPKEDSMSPDELKKQKEKLKKQKKSLLKTLLAPPLKDKDLSFLSDTDLLSNLKVLSLNEAIKGDLKNRIYSLIAKRLVKYHTDMRESHKKPTSTNFLDVALLINQTADLSKDDKKSFSDYLNQKKDEHYFYWLYALCITEDISKDKIDATTTILNYSLSDADEEHDWEPVIKLIDNPENANSFDEVSDFILKHINTLEEKDKPEFLSRFLEIYLDIQKPEEEQEEQEEQVAKKGFLGFLGFLSNRRTLKDPQALEKPPTLEEFIASEVLKKDNKKSFKAIIKRLLAETKDNEDLPSIILKIEKLYKSLKPKELVPEDLLSSLSQTQKKQLKTQLKSLQKKLTDQTKKETCTALVNRLNPKATQVSKATPGAQLPPPPQNKKFLSGLFKKAKAIAKPRKKQP